MQGIFKDKQMQAGQLLNARSGFVCPSVSSAPRRYYSRRRQEFDSIVGEQDVEGGKGPVPIFEAGGLRSIIGFVKGDNPVAMAIQDCQQINSRKATRRSDQRQRHKAITLCRPPQTGQ